MADTKPQTIFFPGPLPGLNDLVAHAKRRRARWNGYAALKHAVQRDLVVELRRQRIRPTALPVHLEFQWIEPHRRRDPDNIAAGGRKLILDALVAAGILPADGWRAVLGWADRFSVDPTCPGVRVVLREVTDENHPARQSPVPAEHQRGLRRLAGAPGVRRPLGPAGRQERPA